MKPLHWDAINPFTGQIFTYDDPNVHWDFYLEPGDPGFTPYDTLSPTTKPTKNKKMKRQTYFPSRVANQIPWLSNFQGKLASYQAILINITAGQISAGIADAKWLIYLLETWLPSVRAFAPSCTAAVELAMTGTGNTPQVLTVFAAPALPAGTVAVPPGALDRIFALIADIKVSAGYTDAIGLDLGIVGPEKSAPDFTTIKAELTAEIKGNAVFIGWGWQGNSQFLDILEIQVDRGNGWVHLASDTTPNYTDTTPFPATLTKWKYRAIFRVDDAQVGVWSDVVEVAVGG